MSNKHPSNDQSCDYHSLSNCSHTFTYVRGNLTQFTAIALWANHDAVEGPQTQFLGTGKRSFQTGNFHIKSHQHVSIVKQQRK